MKLVRQTGVIFLVLVMAITSTSLQQVFKLPLLVNHYYEHKQADNRITVLAFLKLHYFEEEEGEDADDTTDQQLPFKSVNHYIPPTVINATPEVTPIAEIKIEQSGTSNPRPVQKTLISSPILPRIWQPPKYALAA